MAYQKTTWQNGDIITAEKLNNIQNGIENISNNNKFIINYDEGRDEKGVLFYTTEVTGQQLYNALILNKDIQLREQSQYSIFGYKISLYQITKDINQENVTITTIFCKFIVNQEQTFLVYGHMDNNPLTITLNQQHNN